MLALPAVAITELGADTVGEGPLAPVENGTDDATRVVIDGASAMSIVEV
jgi:hypothetical protein